MMILTYGMSDGSTCIVDVHSVQLDDKGLKAVDWEGCLHVARVKQLPSKEEHELRWAQVWDQNHTQMLDRRNWEDT
jgi:hypothetical protein